jgi:hypothetical protein
MARRRIVVKAGEPALRASTFLACSAVRFPLGSMQSAAATRTGLNGNRLHRATRRRHAYNSTKGGAVNVGLERVAIIAIQDSLRR